MTRLSFSPPLIRLRAVASCLFVGPTHNTENESFHSSGVLLSIVSTLLWAPPHSYELNNLYLLHHVN